MRQLILTRHAKSDWGDPGLADHDRPLNGRGRRDAPRMARQLAEAEADNEKSSKIQRIISSTALRARTTAAAFGDALGREVELDGGLYLASEHTLLQNAVESEAASVMLVAHNPGITDLAWRLSDGGIRHMPTCAVARFVWRADDWNEAAARPADEWTLETPR